MQNHSLLTRSWVLYQAHGSQPGNLTERFEGILFKKQICHHTSQLTLPTPHPAYLLYTLNVLKLLCTGGDGGGDDRGGDEEEGGEGGGGEGEEGFVTGSCVWHWLLQAPVGKGPAVAAWHPPFAFPGVKRVMKVYACKAPEPLFIVGLY
jgi:hypothetical protein